MNKTDLVAVVAAKTGSTKRAAEAAVNAVVAAVADAVVAGEKVQLAGLGTFSTKTRAARTGRNPKTQKAIKIPARKTVSFVASKAVKEAVNK